MFGFVAIFVLPGFAFYAGMAALSLIGMPRFAGMAVCVPACYAVVRRFDVDAVVGLLLCWSRSAGFWGSLLCPVNVPGVS